MWSCLVLWFFIIYQQNAATSQNPGCNSRHAGLSSAYKKNQAKMQSCWIVDTCLLLSSEEYFVEKMHCELVEMVWNWRFTLNLELQSAHFIFLHAFAFFFFYASWQEIRILVLFGWGKNARRSIVSIRHSVYLSGYGTATWAPWKQVLCLRAWFILTTFRGFMAFYAQSCFELQTNSEASFAFIKG